MDFGDFETQSSIISKSSAKVSFFTPVDL